MPKSQFFNCSVDGPLVDAALAGLRQVGFVQPLALGLFEKHLLQRQAISVI